MAIDKLVFKELEFTIPRPKDNVDFLIKELRDFGYEVKQGRVKELGAVGDESHLYYITQDGWRVGKIDRHQMTLYATNAHLAACMMKYNPELQTKATRTVASTQA